MTGLQAFLLMLIVWKFFSFLVIINVKERPAGKVSTRFKVLSSIGYFVQILLFFQIYQMLNN